MQKKSLLVALFCGALCLTGCLKNEESASVAQVRIAKANELNSIADLNKAKAAAEAVYADAKSTLDKAEAKLKEAEAALVLAQAETEKVRAELLKVRVQLETVKVDEEKIELLKKEAELEVLLAQAEAAKAAAAAAQQFWINKLEDLLAQAEITALKNAKAYMAAENEILKLEGERADSARVYAQLYFQALDTVAKYQVRELQVKVAQVLVERAAPKVREAIYGFIDDNNEQIAENNAKIEAYKKYQTITPEEAEEKYQAASVAAGEAYTAWMEKKQALADAEEAVREVSPYAKTADFTKDWESKFDKVEAEVWGIGEKTIDGVKNHGFYDEDGEFITLWSDEKVNIDPVRYPDIDVYAKGEITSYDDVTIVPAAINYDNIKEALDTAVARREAVAEIGIGFAELFTELQIASLEEKVETLTEEIAAHDKYVKAMKDSVDKYEQAYLDSLAKDKQYKEGAESAWEAFQEYMLYTYPTVSRELFAERAKAQKAYDAKKTISDGLQTKYNTLVDNIPVYKDDVVEAHNNYETAIGDFRKALGGIREWDEDEEEFVPTKEWKAYMDARAAWNPDFDFDVKTSFEPETFFDGIDTPEEWAELDPEALTLYNVDADEVKIPGTNATKVQVELFIARKHVEAVNEKYYMLEQALVRNPKGSANYEYWKEQFDSFVKETNPKGEYVKAYEAQEAAESAAYGHGRTKGAKQEYDEAYAEVEEIIDVVRDTTNYNPFINDTDFHSIVKYPTLAHEDDYWYKETSFVDGKWIIENCHDGKTHVLGTAQKNLADAVKAVIDAEKTTKEPNGELYLEVQAANGETEGAFNTLTSANEALYKEILRVDALTPGEKAAAAEFKDEKADELYKAYKDAQAKVDDVNLTTAWNTLVRKAYGYNPDQIASLGELLPDHDNIYGTSNHQFGWLISSYHVDYEATCLNPVGERVSIASFLYPFNFFNPFQDSKQYQLEEAEEDIEENLPKMLENIKTLWANDIKAYKSTVAGIVATVNGYKANEAGYKAWVAEREAACEARAEATKAEFDARKAKNDANAEYVAARAALNGGVIYEIIDTDRNGKFDYVAVPINKAIEDLEDENEALEKQNERWYQTLKDGKVALGIVNEILDELLEKVKEALDIWNAIANKYKAIMNAYLDIVPNDESETGPLDGEGEGDDEE